MLPVHLRRGGKWSLSRGILPTIYVSFPPSSPTAFLYHLYFNVWSPPYLWLLGTFAPSGRDFVSDLTSHEIGLDQFRKRRFFSGFPQRLLFSNRRSVVSGVRHLWRVAARDTGAPVSACPHSNTNRCRLAHGGIGCQSPPQPCTNPAGAESKLKGAGANMREL